MNIAIDAIAILGPLSKNRGIGNYAFSQFTKMIAMDQKNQYYFFNLIDDFSLKDIVKTDNIEDVHFFTGKQHELISREEYADIYGNIVRNFLKDKKIDVFYITSPFESQVISYRKEWFEGVQTIATVYDIIPYVLKEKYLTDKNTYAWYMKCIDMLRWIDNYVVISGSVKTDMINYLDFPEDKIHVIYGAADDKIYRKIEVTEEEQKKLFQKFSIEKKYIMCTGGDDERKNLEGLIRAYAMIKKQLRDEYQLVIVCKLSESAVARYTDLIHSLNIEGRVILTNFVETEELIQLYNLATLMAFPSLYEGFGLPIVEAWMCGTPVLTSNNSSLGEIGGEGAILVDASKTESVANGIEVALSGTDLSQLLEKGKKRLEIFNWDNVVKKTLKVIDTYKELNHEPVVEKLKIAMFTPIPPMESGISDYSVDIIRTISPYFDIDVYIDDYDAACELPENVIVLNYRKFDSHKSDYYRVIYQVGNSLYHKYMFGFIKKYKGIVVLHDYNMRAVLERMLLVDKNAPQEFEKELSEDLDVDELRDYMSHLNTAYLEKYEINGFVTNYADRIIVHSNYAKNRLLKRNICRNVDVIPHYAYMDAQCKQIEKGKNDEIIFASFGYVHENKRVLQILRAFGRLSREYSNIRYYFVGKMFENLEESFEAIVERYDIKDKVHVTGFVTLEEFNEYLNKADVCLNLRYPYNGESSGSFMRMLGKGKCAIVNNIGSFAEVPDDTCVKLKSVEDMDECEEIMSIYEAMKKVLDFRTRAAIQQNAYDYAKRELSLERVGVLYREALLKKNHYGLTERNLKSFWEDAIKDKMYSIEEFERIAETLAYSKGC